MLAVTANRFNRRASELLGILDDTIALAFDVECAQVLHDDDNERQEAMLAAMGLSVATSQLPAELRTATGPRRIRQ